MANKKRRAPATGSTDSRDTEMSPGDPEEEPEVSGTIFLSGILLMLIFGFWVLMYLFLLDR